MANPTAGDVWVNRPLTNLSLAWIQSQANFIADKVAPAMPVQNQSGLIWRYNKDDFLRDEVQVRAPGTPSAGGGFKVDADLSYACVIKAFHKDIDDPTRANADSVLQLDTAATRFVTQKMMIEREKSWANAFFKTGVWGTDITPGTLWSASSGATPRKNVDTGKAAILSTTGFEPNTLVLGYDVFLALRNCPEVADQFKYTSADSIDTAMLAAFFGVQNLYVAKGIASSTVEGDATPSYGFTHGKHALLCYVDPRPSLMSLTSMVTFVWSGFTGAIDGMRIKRFRLEERESDRIEAQTAYDHKVLENSLGYFFNSVVS